MSVIEKIESFVTDRKLILVSNSPSVEWWAERKHVFTGVECVFGAVNYWRPIERDIINPNDKNLDILLVGEHRAFNDDNISFADRKDKLMFITAPSKKLIKKDAKYSKNIKRINRFFGDRDVIRTRYSPYKMYGEYSKKNALHFPRIDTIQALSLVLLLGKPREIFIIGADANSSEEFRSRYEGKCHYGCDCGRIANYAKSTNNYNTVMKRAISEMIKSGAANKTPIYLCGENSNYDFGTKISKEVAIEKIREQ